ncbi:MULTISPECIES: pyocin knob domain-containing protein [unclassified Serratia (in: enterobacteria)]|uniref:pyocin knob domain-containing protein n=1 Tax=unclassified Serratia (in: enterobacteria) TaxID=2647522 RepID=UPI00068B4D2E|nr:MULTISPECIES: pyocin knob domain-containing protein [unclassified Serratia (in: enterobacteria)]
MASTAWYRTGTIALVQNSATVTGTGTQWNNPVYGVAPGQMLLVPGAGTVVMYEIQRVISDTQLTLATPYTGSAATGQQYAIVTALVGSVADFSRQLSVLVNQWQSQLDGWQQILSGAGDVKLTAPDGSTVTVKSQAALTAAVNDTLNKSTTTTQTVASAVEFKKSITSNGDQQMRATSTTPNLLLRFRDVNDVEKGAVFSDTATGNMTIRWNGTAYSMSAKADGSVTFPGPLYSNNTQVATRATPLGTSDLNTIKTEGAYYQSMNSNISGTSNYPAVISGTLLVLDSRAGVAGANGNTFVTQRYYPYSINDYYYQRNYSATSSTWSAWDVYESRSKNDTRYLKIGDYGLGSGPLHQDDTKQSVGKIYRITANSANKPAAEQLYGVLSLPMDGTPTVGYVFVSASGKLRTGLSGASGSLTSYGVWGDYNTTVDANGFIKKASPIVKLFGDGSSELNNESQSVTTERVSEGVYRVSGTLGFNSDAEWGGIDGGIEIPTDRNKLPLVWVDYEVEQSGDLLIKTFHRANLSAPTFAQNTISGYKDGDPIDVPAGRWLDLRVQVYGAEPEPEVVDIQPTTELEGEPVKEHLVE